jgi:hypothetical protein
MSLRVHAWEFDYFWVETFNAIKMNSCANRCRSTNLSIAMDIKCILSWTLKNAMLPNCFDLKFQTWSDCPRTYWSVQTRCIWENKYEMLYSWVESGKNCARNITWQEQTLLDDIDNVILRAFTNLLFSSIRSIAHIINVLTMIVYQYLVDII